MNLNAVFRPIDRWSGELRIPLRNRVGRVAAHALIDVADAGLLHKPWYRLASGYAVRTEVRDGKKYMVYLHREIMGLEAGDCMVVDHRNGNKLDNRRANLRVVPPSVNSRNRGANGGRRLPRNVYRARSADGYRVQVKVEGRAVHVGSFASVEDANRAAVAARIRYGIASLQDLQEAKRILDGHHGGDR